MSDVRSGMLVSRSGGEAETIYIRNSMEEEEEEGDGARGRKETVCLFMSPCGYWLSIVDSKVANQLCQTM